MVHLSTNTPAPPALKPEKLRLSNIRDRGPIALSSPVTQAIELMIQDNDCSSIRNLDPSHLITDNVLYLKIAAHLGRPEIARRIIYLNSDPMPCLEHSARSRLPFDYLLRLAIASNQLVMAKLFVEHGASVQCYDNHSLHIACCNGYYDIAEYLLQSGAHLHIDRSYSEGIGLPSNSLLYALEIAASNGHTSIIDLLIKYEPSLIDEHNRAVSWARQNGHANTASRLIELGLSTEEERGASPRSRMFDNLSSSGLSTGEESQSDIADNEIRYIVHIGADRTHFWAERALYNRQNQCIDRQISLYNDAKIDA